MTTDAQDSPLAWVPVEHRWFGLDRRTFRPALIALAISLLLIYGWQAVNAAIPWHNEIKAGDVLDLGGGATVVPPVGWQLKSGALVGSVPGTTPTSLDVVLTSGGAAIELRGVSFTGTAGAFLDQVQHADDEPAAADGPRSTVTTEAGLVGVAQSSTAPSGDRLDVAFKMATGSSETVAAAPALLVRVRTAPGQLEQDREQVQALLSSITPEVDR